MRLSDVLTKNQRKDLLRYHFYKLTRDKQDQAIAQFLKLTSPAIFSKDEIKFFRAELEKPQSSSPTVGHSIDPEKMLEYSQTYIEDVKKARNVAEALICAFNQRDINFITKTLDEVVFDQKTFRAEVLKNLTQGIFMAMMHAPFVKDSIYLIERSPNIKEGLLVNYFEVSLSIGDIEYLEGKGNLEVSFPFDLTEFIPGSTETFLHRAVSKGYPTSAISYLLAKGLNVLAYKSAGQSPVEIAIQNPSARSCLPLLLEAMPDINAPVGTSGFSLLKTVVVAGDENLFDQVMKRNPNVNLGAPIVIALSNKQVGMAIKLIEAGASVDISGLFDIAIKTLSFNLPENKKLLDLMIESITTFRYLFDGDLGVMNFLIVGEHVDNAKKLVDKGYPLNHHRHKFSPLFLSVRQSNFQLVMYFVEQGLANINCYLDLKYAIDFNFIQACSIIKPIIEAVSPVNLQQLARTYSHDEQNNADAAMLNKLLKEFVNRMKIRHISPIMLAAVLAKRLTLNAGQKAVAESIYRSLMTQSGAFFYHYFEVLDFYDDLDQVMKSFLERSKLPEADEAVTTTPSPRVENKEKLISDILKSIKLVSDYIEQNSLQAHIPNRFNLTQTQLQNYQHETLVSLSDAISEWEDSTLRRLSNSVPVLELSRDEQSLASQEDNVGTVNLPINLKFKGVTFSQLANTYRVSNHNNFFVYFAEDQIRDFSSVDKSVKDKFRTLLENDLKFCAAKGESGVKRFNTRTPISALVNNELVLTFITHELKILKFAHRILLAPIKADKNLHSLVLLLAVICRDSGQHDRPLHKEGYSGFNIQLKIKADQEKTLSGSAGALVPFSS